MEHQFSKLSIQDLYPRSPYPKTSQQVDLNNTINVNMSKPVEFYIDLFQKFMKNHEIIKLYGVAKST